MPCKRGNIFITFSLATQLKNISLLTHAAVPLGGPVELADVDPEAPAHRVEDLRPHPVPEEHAH